MGENEVLDEEFEQFLIDICRFNYENPDGSFYEARKFFNNKSFDQLPDYAIDVMKKLLRKALETGDSLDPRLTEKENKLFWKKSCETIPTDEILFPTFNDGFKLSSFWMPPGYKQRGTPADLIFSKTVPLTDVVLNFREFAKIEDQFISATFRVFLYENYQEIVDRVKKQRDCLAIIGGIIPRFQFETKKKRKQKDYQIAYPIVIGGSTDFLMVINIAYKNCHRESIPDRSMRDIHVCNTMVLNVFYGCQLALLNPIIENVFVKAREHPLEERKITNGQQNKNRKIIYVKRYYIREKDITKTIEDYKSHNVKCPLWWVIGHRREYKSGKTIWISGYWKGKDRDKVKHLTEQDSLQLRKRLIDMRSVE